MEPRERVRTIISGKAADRFGFWLGNPHKDTWPILRKFFRNDSEEAIRRSLGDDFRWISPQFFESTYRHPGGRTMFDDSLDRHKHMNPPFADCEDAAEVENYEWPNPQYLHFDECLDALAGAGPYYRASGFWTPFYHNVMDLFGMDQYMMKMHLNPEVVHAVTDKVCSFYYEANERFFKAAGDLADAFFFGNDFGTQQSLICGPDQFDEYIMGWFRKFTEQGHRWGKQVILHSCGAIHKVIDRLIDAGVDCLHPLQALARDMDADSLARDFKGRIAFMGGIDNQQLLMSGTPEEVRREVRRVRAALGPALIVSPSHECLLPNVPPENVLAMAEAAAE